MSETNTALIVRQKGAWNVSFHADESAAAAAAETKFKGFDAGITVSALDDLRMACSPEGQEEGQPPLTLEDLTGVYLKLARRKQHKFDDLDAACKGIWDLLCRQMARAGGPTEADSGAAEEGSEESEGETAEATEPAEAEASGEGDPEAAAVDPAPEAAPAPDKAKKAKVAKPVKALKPLKAVKPAGPAKPGSGRKRQLTPEWEKTLKDLGALKDGVTTKGLPAFCEKRGVKPWLGRFMKKGLVEKKDGIYKLTAAGHKALKA